MNKVWIWLRRLAVGSLALVLVMFAGIKVWQLMSDGPTGPLSGGSFTSGEWVQQPVQEWSALAGDFEFELVGPGTSRTAGGVLLDQDLYISCDLGFIWGRLPASMQRNILHLIWLFKDWHQVAEQDGRVVIRKDGRLYPVQITRVTDAATLERLKTSLELLAAEFFAPGELGPRPTEPPNDIWFFKVTNRQQ